MKILFIGGTGNISTDCAALLHQRGHEISVVTRGKLNQQSNSKADGGHAGDQIIVAWREQEAKEL
jgi:predicted dinucleotide-binding enzyme